MKLRVSLLLLAVAAGLVGCATPNEQARAKATDQATTGARNAVEKSLEYLRTNLGAQTFANVLKSLPDNFQPGVVTVHDSTQNPSGAFSARAVVIGTGEAGGGGFYEQLAVRLCVEYSGAGDRVDVADTPCPNGLPADYRGLRIEQNVTLK